MRSAISRRLAFVAAPAVLWVAYGILIALYAMVRAQGGVLPIPAVDPSIVDSLAGGSATHWLQQMWYPGHRSLDHAAFYFHLSWFFLPLVFGLAITLFERPRLMEFLGWLVLASYASTIFYLILPTSPPWMEPGIHRILLERSFVQYTQLDDNPYAAFPSLHAGLPLVIGLFLLIRGSRLRLLGWVAVAFSVAISFAVVYLGEHWVIDVLGGWALAGFVAWLFTSRVTQHVAARIPGDPIGKLSRLNERLSTYSSLSGPEQASPEPESLPRAA